MALCFKINNKQRNHIPQALNTKAEYRKAYQREDHPKEIQIIWIYKQNANEIPPEIRNIKN